MTGAAHRSPPGLDETAGPRRLLRRERTQGYPPEYVLARIRGRRSRLIRDWRPLVYDNAPLEHLASTQYQGFVRERTAEGMWRALLLEHGWVHGQLDEDARRAFAPYFLYAELRTVFICLRHLEGGKAEAAGELLGASLLSAGVKSALREGGVAEAIGALERHFSSLSPALGGWGDACGEEGLRCVERIMTRQYLAYALELPLLPVVRELFRRIIDSRNILAFHKALRGGTEEKNPFMDGGITPPERLQALLEKDDIMAVVGLVRRASGFAIAAPDPVLVETALYRGISRRLRAYGRDPLGEALLLDYLWRCQLEVMNLSMLLATRDLEREEVLAELVR